MSYFLYGLKVVIIKPITINKVSLSQEVMCTDDFRIEFGKWLAEFFGVEVTQTLRNGTVILDKRLGTVAITEHDFEVLKANELFERRLNW